MLHEVKIFDKNMKIKAIISEKQMREREDEKWRLELLPSRNRERYRDGVKLSYKNKRPSPVSQILI